MDWHPKTPDLRNGQEILLSRLEAGDYFGEIGLLNDQPRNATVRVDTGSEAKVLLVARESFFSLMEDSSQTETVIAREMVVRLAALAGETDHHRS